MDSDQISVASTQASIVDVEEEPPKDFRSSGDAHETPRSRFFRGIGGRGRRNIYNRNSNLSNNIPQTAGSERENRNGLRRLRTRSGPPLSFNQESPVMSMVHITQEEKTLMKHFATGRTGFPHYANDQLKYPLLYLSPAGSISIVFGPSLIIETAVDHSMRLVNHGKYAVYMDGRGQAASIVHKNARIILSKNTVCGRFSSTNDKLIIVGGPGVFFTMDHLREGYLVNNSKRGTSAISLDQLSFPRLNTDYTMLQFYTDAKTGPTFVPLCQEIINNAIYYSQPDGNLLMQINGMTIRHSTNGELVIDARPRHISCSPDGRIHVRSPHIDMGIQNRETAFIKFNTKRVHVSCSGMVVSDGSSCCSMDHFGRIIAST